MARNRQRARDRKARRDQAVDPDRRPLHRENVPGPVEHTGEVDEFEAALVAGAGGDPAEPGPEDRAGVEPPVTDPDAPEPAEEGDPLVTRSDKIAGRADGAAPVAETKRGVSRFPDFLRAVWAELQRVQWPDRRQVGQATAVVLGFVIVAGAFLGLADFVAERLVELII